MTKYTFKQALYKGKILKKPFRFVAILKHNSKEVKAFLPTPTKIGLISFKDTPCLYSCSKTGKELKYTIQALILKPYDKKKIVVGINQGNINKIYAKFIEAGAFKKILKTSSLKAEVPLGHNRIDFGAKNLWLEVKMPLTVLPFKKESLLTNYKHPGSYFRTIEQYKALTKEAKKGKRAIVFITYLYDAPKYNPFKQNANNKAFIKTLLAASKAGVEFWQNNFEIDSKGITLQKTIRLDFVYKLKPR